MASTGQQCPLCGDSLLRFLFNADGDYVLNCASRVCLYGVLHARVFRVDEDNGCATFQRPPQPQQLQHSSVADAGASITDGASGTCAAVPVPLSFVQGDKRSGVDEVSNQVDFFSTLEDATNGDRGPPINVMDMADPAAGFPEGFDLYLDSNREFDEQAMINQWMCEPAESQPSGVVGIADDAATAPNVPLQAASPLPPLPDPVPTSIESRAPISMVPVQPREPVRVARKVQKPSSLSKTAAKSGSVFAVKSKTHTLRRPPHVKRELADGVTVTGKSEQPKKPKLSVHSSVSEKPPRKLPARLQKSQAIVSVLKGHLGASDDVPSEASSDSGIQSDASSDLSSSSSSLTPIQRLLHIEEAKKRSWGVTGMPGFKPSAAGAGTTMTKERQRKRPAVC